MFKLLNKIKPTRLALFGLLALCFSTVFTATVFADSPVLDRVIKNGVLRVAMSGDQPPFNAISRDKSLIGYDVDLSNAIAGAMQVKAEIIQLPFGDLMEALESGKVDMVVSGMAITPQRTQKVSFVGPYMMSGKSILIGTSAQGKVKTGADFNNADITLVALENSTSKSFAERSIPNAKLKTMATYDEGVKMLMDGKVDAMIADMPACKLAILRNPEAGLAVIEPPLSVEPIGIAIASNDVQFQNLIGNYLDTYEKMGLTTQLRKKWFESNTWIAALP